jgi:predicted alpha/beta-fold hydrolase
MLYANFIEPEMFPNFKRETFKLKDGGQLSLDWMIREKPENLIVITHGLTGGTDCNYIKDAVDRFYNAGFSVVCVN